LPNVLGQPTIAMFDVAFPRIQLVPYSGYTTPRHVNMTAVLLKIPGPEYGTYASNDEEHSESSVGQFVLGKTSWFYDIFYNHQEKALAWKKLTTRFQSTEACWTAISPSNRVTELIMQIMIAARTNWFKVSLLNPFP
jgi:hypothetical protein